MIHVPARRRAGVLILGCAALAVAGCSGGRSQSPGNAVVEPMTEAPAPNNVETMSGATLAQFTGDPAAGQVAFAICQSCHMTTPGGSGIGPTLHGVVGRPANAVEGYNYSPASRASGIVWTPEKIFQFIENPRRVMPGTRMAFAGIADPQRRADLIAYLATLR